VDDAANRHVLSVRHDPRLSLPPHRMGREPFCSGMAWPPEGRPAHQVVIGFFVGGSFLQAKGLGCFNKGFWLLRCARGWAFVDRRRSKGAARRRLLRKLPLHPQTTGVSLNLQGEKSSWNFIHDSAVALAAGDTFHRIQAGQDEFHAGGPHRRVPGSVHLKGFIPDSRDAFQSFGIMA